MSSGDGFGKNVIIYGVDNSSSVHAGKRKKDPTDGLHDTPITRLCRYMYDFLVDYGSIDVDDILDIHKHLTK